MKRNILIASVVALAFSSVMVSCNKENGQTFRLQVDQYGGSAKTTINDDLQTLWTANDIIYINGTDANHTATVTVSDDNYSAMLTNAATPINGNYLSLYPGHATGVSFSEADMAYTLTLPATYAYDNTKLAPMAGVCNDNDGVITFSNIFTMLHLRFAMAPEQVKITSDGTNICGTVTATYNNGSWVTTVANGSTTITITNTDENTDIYVPLVAGTHKLLFEWDNGITPQHKQMTGAFPMQASTLYPVICAYGFTVDDNGRQIYFAPANLQYIGSASTPYWQFANAQWVKLGGSGQTGGGTNGNGQKPNVDRDLFYYASSGLPFTINGTTYGPYYPWEYRTTAAQLPPSLPITNTDGDWGHNTIVNGDDYNWRTPTASEWLYLISNHNGRNSGATTLANIDHPRGGSGYGQAKVHGQNGLVLFPDGYTCPDDIPVNIGWHAVGTASNWSELTDAQWETLEQNGCVFLPATG